MLQCGVFSWLFQAKLVVRRVVFTCWLTQSAEVEVAEEAVGGHSSLHKNLHSHWKNLHDHDGEEEAGGVRPNVGLRGLHCCSGSLWVIWRRTLRSLAPNQVRPRACGNRSIPLGLEPKMNLTLVKERMKKRRKFDSKFFSVFIYYGSCLDLAGTSPQMTFLWKNCVQSQSVNLEFLLRQ